jgi:hypothetical protein
VSKHDLQNFGSSLRVSKHGSGTLKPFDGKKTGKV